MRKGLQVGSGRERLGQRRSGALGVVATRSTSTRSCAWCAANAMIAIALGGGRASGDS